MHGQSGSPPVSRAGRELRHGPSRLSQRNWSWSSSGRGSPAVISANQTRMAARSLAASRAGPPAEAPRPGGRRCRAPPATPGGGRPRVPPGLHLAAGELPQAGELWRRIAPRHQQLDGRASRNPPPHRPPHCISPVTAPVYGGQWWTPAGLSRGISVPGEAVRPNPGPWFIRAVQPHRRGTCFFHQQSDFRKAG